ncbi:hypothetical protein MBLNU13_g00377t1 [Cladosporium sp. NU13]
MPFPFGVSVGDFIACIELINTIINCLDQSHGSDARFRDVSRSLKSLEIALMEVNKITASSNDEVALRQVSMQCRSTLSTFLNKIKKYQPNLQLGGSGNHLMDNLRKVQWALYTKDDVAHFQLEIRGHVDSILILLGMLQSSRLEALRVDLQLQIAEQRSLRVLLHAGLTQCATHVQRAFQMIFFANIALFYSVTLDFVLRRRIAEDMELPNFARAGRYLLRYLPTYEEVPRGSRFMQVFRPDARLIMPLLLSYDDQNVDICPACHYPNDITGKFTLQCGPAHRKLLADSREAKATVDEEIVHPPAPVVQDALERLQLFPTNNIPRFKIVQNVENVDVSSARMVSVLDLLGYMYVVPWHMVRTAEQMRFFLRFLTAGGSVLDWTHDYVIVDDEDTELTPANWESGAHHGISVTLHLGNRDGLVALQDMLRSKIRGILSTSAPTFRGQGIRDVVEKVCLLVGASKAQFEIRNLVRDTGKLAPARGLHA